MFERDQPGIPSLLASHVGTAAGQSRRRRTTTESRDARRGLPRRARRTRCGVPRVRTVAGTPRAGQRPVLPVDGAGISLFFSSDRRLPLGASDPASAEAERLQFTAGEGPCLTSHATGAVVLADAATLRARWPGYYAALAASTPIRGSLSLPLRNELSGIGALDLYVVSPREVASLSVDDALAVAAQVAAVLLGQSRQDRLSSSGGPAWLDAPAAERRPRCGRRSAS